MKLIKKYRWIILGFFILFIIVLVWFGMQLFVSQDGALYGHRLEGRGDVPIGSDVKTGISDLLSATAGVKKVDVNVQGKILYIVILVDETMTADKAKEISNQAVAKLSAEQAGFYDVSILVDYQNDTTATTFPLLGYKNKNSDHIVW
jgi:hypothetical protein